MTFKPFYSQWERRNATYFSKYNDAEWAEAQVAYKAEQARLKDEAARSVDVMHLGEMQPERDHNLKSEISYPVIYRGRQGRDARTLGFFSFEMNTQRDGKDVGPLILQATYWGSENNRVFDILVDGVTIAHERLTGRQPGAWIDVDYPIPLELTKGKAKVTIKFDQRKARRPGRCLVSSCSPPPLPGLPLKQKSRHPKMAGFFQTSPLREASMQSSVMTEAASR